MKKTTTLWLSIGFFVSQLIFYYTLRFFPVFIERLYSHGIYPTISSISRLITGWVPFSIGDVVYLGFIFLALIWLWKSRMELITLSRKRYTQLITALNIILLFFHVAWGFNYYRQPLNKTLEIDDQYTTEELKAVVTKLIKKSNELHTSLQPLDSLAVAFTRTQDQLFELAPTGYERLSKEFPSLKYQNSSIKKSMLTLPLSYQFAQFFICCRIAVV